MLSNNDLQKAIELISNVDVDDSMFVALTNHLSAHLWTGDRQLIKGLKKKGYSNVITSNGMFDVFMDKQLRSRK